MQRIRVIWLGLFVVCAMMVTTTVSANDNRAYVELKDNDICVSSPVNVPLTSVMLWNVENTGNHPVYYSVLSCCTVTEAPKSVESGTLHKGQRISGSKCAVDLDHHQYFILLSGEDTTGKAELTAK